MAAHSEVISLVRHIGDTCSLEKGKYSSKMAQLVVDSKNLSKNLLNMKGQLVDLTEMVWGMMNETGVEEGGKIDVWMSFQLGNVAVGNFIALAMILGACFGLFILGLAIGACVGRYRRQLETPRGQTMAQVRQRQNKDRGNVKDKDKVSLSSSPG